MQTQDVINGLFEGIGGLILLMNVKALARDKKVSGVRVLPTVFWTAWGLWNLFYYPSLGQRFSFYGGCGVVLANAAWLALAWKYRRN